MVYSIFIVSCGVVRRCKQEENEKGQSSRMRKRCLCGVYAEIPKISHILPLEIAAQETNWQSKDCDPVNVKKRDVYSITCDGSI